MLGGKFQKLGNTFFLEIGNIPSFFFSDYIYDRIRTAVIGKDVPSIRIWHRGYANLPEDA
jgi:hypothetical protein